MAFLGKGEEMFISWKMPSCEVRVGDEVEMYGIVRTGFDALKGARFITSIFRPVCSNTINLAEGWAKKNADGNLKGSIWKSKGINQHLLRDLGYWMAHIQGNALREVELLKGFFGLLASTPIHNDNEADTILAHSYPLTTDISGYYPNELRDKKAETIEAYNSAQLGIRNGIYELFAGKGIAITPDYWGMLNATSEYFCHYQPSKRPIAESVMFGGRQKNIMNMVTTLSEMTR